MRSRSTLLAAVGVGLASALAVFTVPTAATAARAPLPASSTSGTEVSPQVAGAVTLAATAIKVLPLPGVNLSQLPLGDTKVTLTTPQVGWEWACAPGNPNAPGAIKDGPWMHGSTWDLLSKVAVSGAVSWTSSAKYTTSSTATTRTITTMRVPTVGTTGNFPISPSDPAYEYDHNPGSVKPSQKTVTLPLNPVKASKASCLPMGAIGVAKNGVMLYNALDARNQDARAHEMQDSCEGHPNPTEYHYHAGSACVVGSNTNAGPNSAVLFGYAYDGFGIYIERDAAGNMLTNKDLDACHGRTSTVVWNGVKQSIYHYVVTQQFPYLLGCFRGTNAVG